MFQWGDQAWEEPSAWVADPHGGSWELVGWRGSCRHPWLGARHWDFYWGARGLFVLFPPAVSENLVSKPF